jgi:hypothetical protein
MQVKAVETMVDMHRQELQRVATTRVPRGDAGGDKEARAAQRSAAGIPVPGGRAVRRAVAPRIGSWLIHAGVRLGGASFGPS